MPVMHVAATHGLSWLTVRRAEERAIARWEATRPTVPLRHVGVDEKWLGRRHNLEHKFVTVVNLETGEPIWIGRGRSEKVLRRWLESLSREQKATVQLFAMDLHRPFWNAVDNTRGLEHAPIVHDPFHIMKLAGAMIDELRREVFFRAGPELRAIGRGRRWLLLRPWERTSEEDRLALRQLLGRNRTLARGYQIKEELREIVLCAPDRAAMEKGLDRILRRTRRYEPRALRRLHDTLNERYNEAPYFCSSESWRSSNRHAADACDTSACRVKAGDPRIFADECGIPTSIQPNEGSVVIWCIEQLTALALYDTLWSGTTSTTSVRSSSN